MLAFDLSDTPLQPQEQELFRPWLDQLGLDEAVWPVFDRLFASATPHTRPQVLRARDGGRLRAAAILVRCGRYGQALFARPSLVTLLDLLAPPLHLWFRYGCGMDMMSNPGFFADPDEADDLVGAMAAWLKRHTLATMIYDYSDRAALYPEASELPGLPHALIETAGMTETSDYTGTFGKIGRKVRRFRNKGGTFERIEGPLSDDDLAALRDCFVSTAERSAVPLPYQDLYLASALATSGAGLQNVHHFVARLDGELLGYQAAVQSGKHLNALHGAFDRRRKTTYNAYDLLFIEMVDFALEHNVDSIDVGSVLNQTKQKMVNATVPMSYFLLSRLGPLQTGLAAFLKTTRVQSAEQQRFREATPPTD
jgi:hypothetical protein